MGRNDLSIPAAFLAVAEGRSFTQAGKRLGVSPSAMSHAIRGLEENVGVRLLSRTTRSVAPTEAGERLLARLRPGLAEIQEALDQISELRDKPAGSVRLLVPRLAGTMVIGPKLAKFTRDYPDVVLDITADDSRLDIVAGGFDAGIHFGEYIQKDMIAVRVSKDHRAASSARPRISSRTPGRKRRTICSSIGASTSGMDLPGCTGWSSTKAKSPCPWR
jgi:DNA-binding transcriptional LysR family regulator